MNDRDQSATLSLSQSDDQPGRLWDFGDPSSNEDRSAAELATGLTSLGFIRAALRRSARLWCATAVIGLLAGFGVLKALPPAYQASTSVLLANNPFELASDAALNDQAIAQSRTVAGAALRKLGLQQSAASFVGDYTVTIVTNQVLLITVKATSSDQAVREANALVRQMTAASSPFDLEVSGKRVLYSTGSRSPWRGNVSTSSATRSASCRRSLPHQRSTPSSPAW